MVWVVVVVGAYCGDYKFNRGASGNCDYGHSGSTGSVEISC